MVFGGFEVIYDSGDGGAFGFVDGMIAAVPSDRREEFAAFAEGHGTLFKEYGALRAVDGWGTDVPEGKVTEHEWTDSKVYPGTVRKYWVYVPAQYKADKPACLMVFQDGGGYVKRDGSWRVPVVFDNLIAKKDMPVTVAVFINPGEAPRKPGEENAKRPDGRPAPRE